MGVNEQRRYVVKPKDPAKLAAEKRAGRRSVGSVLVAQVPGLAGLVLVALGVMMMASLHNSSVGYISTRGGGALIGLGVALIGYWAFSSDNRNYHF